MIHFYDNSSQPYLIYKFVILHSNFSTVDSFRSKIEKWKISINHINALIY